MQKLFCILTLSAGFLFADCARDCCDPCGTTSCDCDPCNTCNTCDSCCCTPCCCEPCDFMPPCPPDTCAYNAPVIIDIKCGWDFYATVSFLYMQAKEENLGFASSIIIPTETIPTTTVNYSSLDFDYEPAFKVGIGFNLGCDNWQFGVEYMRYSADVGSGSFSATADNSLGIVGPWNIGELLDPTSVLDQSSGFLSLTGSSFNASALWHLNMNIVDFDLSRKYFVGRCLTFKSFAGLRAAWINQDYTVNYTTITGSSTTLDTSYNISSKNSIDSWAVGARVGLDTEWLFCGGFFLYADSAFNLLYTDYCVDQNVSKNQVTIATEEVTEQAFVNSSKSLCYLRPQANVGLGLGWSDYFCCNDWFFDFRIGYDFQVYWNQNVFGMNYFTDGTQVDTIGDLYLHGLVITARLDF